MDSPNKDTRERVAAVCYRQVATGIEFLLVRTTGGRRWTFPKGHVETNEQPSRAAEREAREEAGVDVVIDPVVLDRYRYRGSSGPASDDLEPVTAYLAKIAAIHEPDENWRTPTWFSPKQAVRALSKRRTAALAQEHQRIIELSLHRIGGHGGPPAV